MGILSSLQEILIDERPKVEMITERCLRGRLNTCDCRLCLDICPAGALSLIDRRIHIDQDKCTACMCCSAVCPNDALDGGYDVAALLAEISTRRQVIVTCIRKRESRHDEVAVPCLGIFSAESLLALARSGCDRITFSTGGCRDCSNHQAAVRLHTSLEHLSRIGATIFSTRLIINPVQTREAETGADDRRSYLAHLVDKFSQAATVGAASKRPRKPKERINGRRIPAKVRILEAIVNDADPEKQEDLEELCSHRLNINDDCTLCPRCTAICPTGALKLHRSKPNGQLRFIAAHCSGCGLCVGFCKTKALSLSHPPISDRQMAYLPIPSHSNEVRKDNEI